VGPTTCSAPGFAQDEVHELIVGQSRRLAGDT
jgi:hypothetical protein